MAKPQDALDASTLRTQDKAPASGSRATLPCLTILAHADATRVGQRAVLKALLIGLPVELSRSGPLFEAPGNTTPGSPLADPRLSRTPCVLRASSEGVTIEASGIELTAEGNPVHGSVTFDAQAIARGVVLELGRRVALLLHRHSCRPLTSVEGLLGQSDAIEDTRRELLRVADLDTPVLIRGETGTGKERIAEAIHARSARKGREYVAVNMATIPESVAISSLFGHAKGAFTGAQQRHQGLFERASGGTLLLDEIGETPENVQPMLLRAIETGVVLPLGDERERAIDVRFIAATDADLESELRARSFSAALLHRLAGYEIHTAPMRERREDIAVLMLGFIREELVRIGGEAQLGAIGALLATSGFMARVVRHPLPGNVRQLRNIARHLVISNRGADAPAITPSVERLLAVGVIPEPPSTPLALGPVSAGKPPEPLPSARPPELDEASLLRALQANAWSPNRTAASLGIPTGTLHSLMRKSNKLRRAADLEDEELRAAILACGGDTHAMAECLCVSERGLRLTLRQRGLLEGS